MSTILTKYGVTTETVYRNLSVAKLYEFAIRDEGSQLAANGALVALSGEKTGRCPKDKRIVDEPQSSPDIWWGEVNKPLPESSFALIREEAVAHFNASPRLYVVDCFAAWAPEHRIKVRVICTRAYHALFMHNMVIRPTDTELAEFGEPDWVIMNAGIARVTRNIPGVTSDTSIPINFKTREVLILGTEYAGEMKKGVFTVLNYTLPKKGVMPMHCSANEGTAGDTALFFGLSGTGKTTLSADPRRRLIGDDEHGWSDQGVFCFEGGCYAKTVDLSPENEPEIYNAIRFGSVLENVVMDPESREVNYKDISITENTRASYPIEYIPNAKVPCVGGHPKNVIFLTCDAFGVLPPVSRLNSAQAMYHFISGYTAKVAGTEQGVKEPQATFSACFGAAFMVWHPARYAELLKAQIEAHNARVWLVNTGWSGGPYGVGKRFALKYTRAIIDAILDGSLDQVTFANDATFGLAIPSTCPNVPSNLLNPKSTWADGAAYDKSIAHLADLFRANFAKFADRASNEIKSGGP